MQNSILIFPAGIEQSLQYYRQTQQQNIKVVGASSLENDPVSKQFELWLELPYITDDRFEAALINAIEKYHIDGIYTPHMAIWDYLHKLLKKISPDATVTLVNSFPFDEEISEFLAAEQFAAELLQQPRLPDSSLLKSPELSVTEAAALFHHAENIYGQCSLEKMLALCDIARASINGDIVEIGVFCGKSAFILAWLSKHYGIGKLLCVDPWSFEESVEQDDSSGVLSDAAPRLDLNYAKELFKINLLPYNETHINYLQMTSFAASQKYRPQFEVSDTAFGKTIYTGKIAILHIDGNHAYQAACLDIQSWYTNMADGGWIIMDDYNWPFGDGPKRAGDEFLEEKKDIVNSTFIAGGALFINIKK